jgi:hypothetical protein
VEESEERGMNLFTYFKQKREAKKRRQVVIALLHQSSVLRSAQENIRYTLSPREMRKLLEQ